MLLTIRNEGVAGQPHSNSNDREQLQYLCHWRFHVDAQYQQNDCDKKHQAERKPAGKIENRKSQLPLHRGSGFRVLASA